MGSETLDHVAFERKCSKAILAFQPAHIIEGIERNLAVLTPQTVNSLKALQRELSTIRSRGYAVNLGEWRGRGSRRNLGAVDPPELGNDRTGRRTGRRGCERHIAGAWLSGRPGIITLHLR
ncbi:IclR family transcriptional regulator domain-containing protein [Bosea sp. LjRoot9]|uniref:IclR family transcriptional regulator domain-containing protein n=1 Tax=Bosea sp. LjRoot9 TaxID=3342341 RepID=UPI003F50B39E